jgi:flagellar biosynthesis/type III secretory pathway M-ring protein FliF/YscJ
MQIVITITHILSTALLIGLIALSIIILGWIVGDILRERRRSLTALSIPKGRDFEEPAETPQESSPDPKGLFAAADKQRREQQMEQISQARREMLARNLRRL